MEGIPEHFTLAYTRDEINARVRELGSEIAPWIERAELDSRQAVLAVCILRGAAFFFADLLRAVPYSVEISFLRAWGYSDDSEQRSSVRIASDDLDVSDRAVLVVDEICDSGSTLQTLEAMFLAQGAREVKAAVAISRDVENPKYLPEWSAFRHAGPEWFVGYGMDSSNRFRNMPDIYRIPR